MLTLNRIVIDKQTIQSNRATCSVGNKNLHCRHEGSLQEGCRHFTNLFNGTQGKRQFCQGVYKGYMAQGKITTDYNNDRCNREISYQISHRLA